MLRSSLSATCCRSRIAPRFRKSRSRRAIQVTIRRPGDCELSQYDEAVPFCSGRKWQRSFRGATDEPSLVVAKELLSPPICEGNHLSCSRWDRHSRGSRSAAGTSSRLLLRAHMRSTKPPVFFRKKWRDRVNDNVVGYVKDVILRRGRLGHEQGRTMRKNLENRLISVGCVALFGLSACTVAVKSEPGDGGTTSTGSGGSATGGSAGSGGTTTSAGGSGGEAAETGGAAGDEDAGSTDGPTLPSKDGGSYTGDAGCVDDPTDAGAEANPDLCSQLNGANGGPQCYDTSPGRALCDEMHKYARKGAFQVFFDCINDQTKNDACASVDICLDETHWPTGCQVGKVVISNGKSWDCTNLVDRCGEEGGPNGFTLPECDFIMNVFTDEARTKIFDCYLFKNGGFNSPTCRDDFTSCVFDPDQGP
jgi:hypothetical protein